MVSFGYPVPDNQMSGEHTDVWIVADGGIARLCPPGSFKKVRAISFYDRQISLYDRQISFNDRTHILCGFGHKVKTPPT